MALPKGAENLGAQAKEIAAKVSQPIASKVDDVRQQVATQEGLKNIAFTASGRDPVIGITTGIALGISALGIGLGAKGLKGAFKGVGRLLGGLKPDEQDDQEFGMEGGGTEDNADKLDALMRANIGDDLTLEEFKSQTEIQLSQLLRLNENQLSLSEAVLTNAARERLEAAREESTRIETEREAKRLQEEMLDLMRGVLPGGGDGINEPDKLKPRNIIKDLFIGKGLFAGLKLALTGLFLKLPTLILSGIKSSLGGFGKLLLGGLAKLNIAGIFLGVGFALAEGIGDAIESFTESGSILKALGNFVTGTLGAIASFFTLGLLNKDKIQQFLNKIFPTIGNFLKDSFFFLGGLLIDSGKLLFEKIKEKVLGSVIGFGDAFSEVSAFVKEKAATAFGEILDGITDTFSNIMTMARLAIIGMLEKIPGVGDSLAKQFMTPQERAELELREQRDETNDRLTDIQEKKRKIEDRKTNIVFTEKRKQAQLESLGIQEETAENELKNLQKVITPPAIQPSDRPSTNLAAIRDESAAMRLAPATTTVVNAPTVSNNSQTQNVSNTMIAPLSVKNGDASVDRAFAAQF